MSIFQGYQVDDNYTAGIEEGEHLLTVKKAVERESRRSGNLLLEIELQTKNGFRLYYHIVEGDYFNKKLTQFYDCFGIQRGNQQLDSWIGCSGKAFVAKGKPQSDGKQYSEIKYLIVNPPQAQRNNNAVQPPAAYQQQSTSVPSQQPQQQQSYSGNTGYRQSPNGATPSAAFEDDIPF